MTVKTIKKTERTTKVTKRADIFSKLKANLWILLPICLGLFLLTYSTPAEALFPCTKERMDRIYKSGCYACDIVSVLIGSFIGACTYLYGIAKEAGTKLLAVGLMLWLAFYILKQLSSLKNLEPATMVNDLLIMAFKVLVAYVIVNAGISFFIDFGIVPFMNFGAEFGITMVETVSHVSGLNLAEFKIDSAYEFKDGIVPANFLNLLQKYVGAVDYTVSTHMQIGHLLTCHATGAGAWHWVIAVIPNIWLWISGAFIWLCGFMMTLSVTYYLVDLSFKLGFAIVALPITVGLWPFNVTKGKVKSCFGIILHSAGVLIFLAMTVSAGLALVSAALDYGQEEVAGDTESAYTSGADKLMQKIEAGDNEYVSEQFSFWSFRWIVILFAYLYAIKLIGSTITDYVNNFFGGLMSKASPMHRRLTQATDMAKAAAKSTVTKPFRKAKQIAKAQTKKATRAIANKFKDEDDKKDKSALEKVEDVSKKTDRLSSGQYGQKSEQKNQSTAQNAKAMTNLQAKDKENMNKQKGEGGAGEAMQKSGQAMENAGQQLKQTADNIDQTLANAKRSMKAGNQAIQSAAHAGTAASLGIAAPVTETTAAASAATTTAASTAATAGQTAAKAMKVMGRAMKKMGKIMKKTGKMISKNEKAGKKAANIAKGAFSQAMKGASSGEEHQTDSGMIGQAFDDTVGKGKNKK